MPNLPPTRKKAAVTIATVLKSASVKLQKRRIASAHLDAEVLLSFVLKKDKVFLFSHPELELTASQLKKINCLVRRRSKSEPVAYLVNQKEFYGLAFYVDKNVLIPRPETELLVEEVINYAKDPMSDIRHPISDIGTGSGCIIIALAKALAKNYQGKNISYFATDLSPAALKIARKNAGQNRVRIKFTKSNLFDGVKERIDVIVANLPYLDAHETKKLKSEPRQALYGGRHGLAVYKKLFYQISKSKYRPGAIFCEINPLYWQKTEKLAREYLPEYVVKTKKDLSGQRRILIILHKPL